MPLPLESTSGTVSILDILTAEYDVKVAVWEQFCSTHAHTSTGQYREHSTVSIRAPVATHR